MKIYIAGEDLEIGDVVYVDDDGKIRKYKPEIEENPNTYCYLCRHADTKCSQSSSVVCKKHFKMSSCLATCEDFEDE